MRRDPDWDWHCVEFAADALRAATGRDVWGEVGACPRSARDVAALYRKVGVTNLADGISKVLGEPVDPKLAKRGDVVMVGGALGICRGEWVECLDGMQPLGRASRAWNVGQG